MTTLTTGKRRKLESLLREQLWRRAKEDPAWFFANCIYVKSQREAAGRELFELYPFQKQTLDTFLDWRWVIVLKARQLGLTTLATAYALHHLLFKPGANVLLVSKNQDAANKALGGIRFMWNFLPQWVRERGPVLVNDSATSMTFRFPDGMESLIKSLPATKTAGAGETASLVLVDEFALAVEQDDAFRTLEPTCDAGGQMIIFSTARGAHNRFARLYRAAKQEASKFVAVFHPWNRSPFVGREEYEAKKLDFKDEPWLFYAEYPDDEDQAFRESGRPRFVNLPALDDCPDYPWRGRIDPDGVIRLDPTGPLRLTDEGISPDRGGTYVMSIDPATGKGLDFTAAHVVTLDETGRPRIVAYWWANDIETPEAAEVLAQLGHHFNEALIVPEKAGGWGDTMIHELGRNNYRHLYTHRPTGHRTRKSTKVIGFPMTYVRRPLVIDRLAEFVSVDEAGDAGIDGIHPHLRYELGTFVRRDDGKVAADVGCHDDLVMSLAIAVWVTVERTAATVAPRVEDTGPRLVTHNLNEMFAEVERVRREQERAQRKADSRRARHFSRGKRRS